MLLLALIADLVSSNRPMAGCGNHGFPHGSGVKDAHSLFVFSQRFPIADGNGMEQLLPHLCSTK